MEIVLGERIAGSRRLEMLAVVVEDKQRHLL